MPGLNNAAMTVGADAIKAALLYAQLHSAAAGGSGTSNIGAVARQAIFWGSTTADGDFGLASALVFTGSGPTYSVTLWSALTGGVFYGEIILTGDTTFNVGGQYIVTTLNLDGITYPITNFLDTLYVIGPVTTTYTIDLINGKLQVATLAASTLCTFTMPALQAGRSFVLYVKQPVSTGGNGTAVFSGVRWPAGTAPVVTPTAGKMDIFSFSCDGNFWYGSVSQGYDTGDQSLTSGAKAVVNLPNKGNAVYPVLRTVRRAVRRRK